jgi:hypothetical protein
MLDRSEVEKMYRDAKRERQLARRQMDLAQQTIQALTRVMDGYAMLYPDLRETEADAGQQRLLVGSAIAKATTSTSNPRGQEAVLTVMKEDGFANHRWTIADMTEELNRRGWPPESENPENAVRAALNRLAKIEGSGVVRLRTKDRGLIFRYRPEGAPQIAKIAEPNTRVLGASKGGF